MPKSAAKASPYTWDEIKKHAEQMESRLAARTELYTQLEKMYALEWTEKPAGRDVKETMSADPHNAVNAVSRLLTTSKSDYNFRPVEDTDESRKEANMLERAMRQIVVRSNRQQNAELEKETVSALSIFGEVGIKTADLRPLQMFKSGGKKNAFVQFPPNLSPLVFKVLHPNTYFYDQAEYGLSAVIEKRERTLGDLKRSWAGKKDLFGDVDDSSTTTFYEYWSWSPFEPIGTRCVWCDAISEPLLEPSLHGFDFLPYSIRFSHSLSFLSDEKYKHMGMLYPLHKAGIWTRLNLLLTIMATNVQLFTNPKWVSKTKDGRKVSFDLNTSGGTVPMFTGESIDPLARQLVPKEVYDLLTLLKQSSEEATVPRVVSGSAPGGVSAGFAINLLSQGGKLVIYPIEEAANVALTDSVEAAMGWISFNKYPVFLNDDLQIDVETAKAYRYRSQVELRSSMPQDKVALGNLWTQLIGAGVGDPRTMWEEMGYADTSEMMDRLLEWMFVKKNIELFVGGEAKEFKLEQPKPLPSGVLPLPMQDGKPPVPPQGVPLSQPPPAGTPGLSPEQLAQMLSQQVQG